MIDGLLGLIFMVLDSDARIVNKCCSRSVHTAGCNSSMQFVVGVPHGWSWLSYKPMIGHAPNDRLTIPLPYHCYGYVPGPGHPTLAWCYGQRAGKSTSISNYSLRNS